MFTHGCPYSLPSPPPPGHAREPVRVPPGKLRGSPLVPNLSVWEVVWVPDTGRPRRMLKKKSQMVAHMAQNGAPTLKCGVICGICVWGLWGGSTETPPTDFRCWMPLAFVVHILADFLKKRSAKSKCFGPFVKPPDISSGISHWKTFCTRGGGGLPPSGE